MKTKPPVFRNIARNAPDDADLLKSDAWHVHGVQGAERATTGGSPVAISLFTLGSAYTQNFDALASTGSTGTSLPTDWSFSETGGSAPTTYTVGTGAGNGGDTYSFGATGSTDRAFGSVCSGTVTQVMIGTFFQNNTGSTITDLIISYVGEQWRNGGNATQQKLDFQYSLDATSITTGTWTDVNALDFLGPIATTTAAALDGNAAANRTAISSTITSLTIANGQTFWIRWVDVNDAGNDHGLAIDDFSLTPNISIGSPGALAINDVSHAEGDSGTTTYSFTVTRSGGSTGAVSATWTLNAPGGAGNADSGDFDAGQATTGTVSFADGETSKTITILVQGDTVVEGDENFTVVLSAPTGGATLADASGLGTIANDDRTLSINDVSMAEGDSGTVTFTFTVSLSGPAPAGGVTFDIATADGTATTGDNDYVGRSLTSQTIPAGQSTYTFDVTVNGDTVLETNQIFFVNVTNVTGATVADGQGTGTITNDDVAPEPGSISIGDVTLAEGDSGTTAFVFTVLRSGGSDGAVGATWTLDAPGGVNLADLVDFAPGQATTGTVSFADGQTSATITILVQGDMTFEPTETFLVNLSNPTGGVALGNVNGTGEITNDDPAPAGSFSINDISLAEGDSGQTAFTFTVVRSGGTAGTVTVQYQTADGTAVDPSDYTAVSGTLTFLDGETSKTITVFVNGDTTFEGDEAFAVNLLNPTGGATIIDGQGTGTITNDDAAPAAGSVSVGDVSIVEGNAGTSILTFTLTRTGGTAAFDVNYATSNGGIDPTHASATSGSDYVATSGTVSFGVGQTTQTVSVTINGDVTPELSEEFRLTLSSPTNGATINDGVAIGTITTDDAPPASTLIFSENFTGFTGGGFAPTPAAGQIDSDIWRVVGLSDIANPAYGFTATTGDFARGTITTNDPTTAGVYSLQSNAAMIIQASAAEMDVGGFIEARIVNTSGSTATGFDVGFDWVYRNNADRADSLTFSYSTDGTNFINVPAAAFTTPGTLAAGATFTMQNEVLTLSGLSVANGDAIYFRWTHVSSAGSGSRDEFGIDNVTVSTTGGATGPLVSVSDVSVNEAAGTMTFTVTRANPAAGIFTVDYATADGTALAGSDYVATSGTLVFADNQTSATVTVQINDDNIAELNETLFLNLSNPTGGVTIADGQGVGTITNDDGTPIQVSINDVSIVEGQSGTSLMTFTVTRTGGTGAFDVSYGTANDTATAGSDYVATSGTLSFGAGVNTQTFTVTINGDLTQEQTERFFVNLSNPTNNAVIIDGQGIGTITNDEPTLIHDIQGTAYFSPLLAGEGVHAFNIASTNAYTIRAIVTAVDNVGTRQGFYVTEEITDWDGNSYTSEGIFVMTRNDANVGNVVSGVAVGDLVQFNANIMEYQSFSTMPRTVLVNPTGLSVVSSGNPLPSVTLTNIPNEIMTVANPDYFDSVDGAGDTFDASLYALSYFETVEGMLVTVPNMVVADGFVSTSGGDPYFQAYSLDSANADQINSRGGYTIAGDPPVGPPDTPGTGDDTVNGGQVLHDGDVNPDMIELDFTDFAISAPGGLATSASMGDFLGDVTGIIDFDFTALKLFVTDIDSGSFIDRTTSIETTTLGGDARSLTVATFNVENLDPTDGAARFTALANAIKNNLNAPDILCIEEMQDNNGAAAGGVDASTTWQMLVDALNTATGKHYQWVDQEPISNAEGGEQQGNIRVGFLYDTDRVQLGNLGANATLAERRMYTDRIGDGVRDAGDLIAFSDNMLGSEINTTDWANTRRSLLGEFHFNGNTVYVTANHFPSKGGSGEFWQLDQAGGDPVNSDMTQRAAVAQDVYSMLNLIQQSNPNVGLVAGGDMNDFYFYRPLTTLTGYTLADGTARVGGTRLNNLTLTLPEAERYTYTFDGRSQAIDHIVVNDLLAGIATYDVVHLNTGFNPTGNPQLSDHDPGVSSYDYRNLAETLAGTTGNDVMLGFGGNDILRGNNGNDVLIGGAGNDTLEGGQGDDTYFVDDLGDVVVETAGNGFDSVYVGFNYALAAGVDVEWLSAYTNAATTALNLVGNSLAQYLVGNAGKNVLYGGGGADVLIGLGGDDSYIVDSAAVQVQEGANGGFDSVFAMTSYTLTSGAEVEWLSTVSNAATTAINLTGNAFGQSLVGNAGVNILDGGAGADFMYGLGGNDSYFVDNVNDYVGEAASGGFDSVFASASYVLTGGQEVEWLATASQGGTAAINLTGNELNNYVVGNAGANVLDGGRGSDTLIGGAGADSFAFTTALGAGNVDVVSDFVAGTDKILLDDAIFTALGLGTLNANAFHTGTGAADGSDRIIYNSATGELWYDADGAGGAAATVFAQLSSGLSLTASDFQVI